VSRALFLAEALQDLRDIRRYIIVESRSIRVAQDFTARLRQRCHDLADLPGTLGRARDDLAPGLRSLAWRDYVILFRYVAGGVQAVRLLHGARDLPTLFTPGSEG
jgi:plasmid stabilization system protein ParE